MTPGDTSTSLTSRTNGITTHTHTHEWHRMTRMTGPDYVVMCNLINTHTHTHTHTVSLIPPREDQCEWHRMTRMTGPDCVVMCNLINTHTHTHTHTQHIRTKAMWYPETYRVRYLEKLPCLLVSPLFCSYCCPFGQSLGENGAQKNTAHKCVSFCAQETQTNFCAHIF